LTYADSFVLAKWLVKHEAISSGFTSNFLPSEAGAIDLNISLKPSKVL
jgi:glutamine synthetase